MDLKESLASLCFAASCCADLPELQEIRDIMVMKYGKDFLTSAHELLPGEHVNRLFLDAFSTKQPLEVSKKALLKGILAEYNVVQPRKPKPPCIDGGSQKSASSDCNISHNKQQSRQECGSKSESCKQQPNLNILDQEEKHNKSPKQIRHTTITPTCGAFTEEHASLSQVEGDWERKMVGRHKKEQKDQVDTVQGRPNETDLALQDGLLLSHEGYGKEKFRNRLKASKRNARIDQVGQEGQHTLSNRMPIYEKTEPDEAASEFVHGLHGYGNSASEKLSVDKEAKGLVSGQHWVQGHGDRGHAKHRENKPSNLEREVLISQPWKHGYHDEALLEDFNTHQMLQEENHKKHNYAEREVHSRSNGKARSGRVRNAFDNVQHEREQCNMDSNHAETKSKHYSRKDRFTNEFDNVQQERSPHRRNHHVEGGTQVDINHRLNKTLRPGKAAYETDNWQSPPIGYGILHDEREPPHADSNYGETHSKHNSRSNGKSRPVRVTDELNNNQQGRSPRRRNHHVDGETKIEMNLTSDEKSRPGKVAYGIENWQSSPKDNGSLPDYADTHKVQREKRKSSKKNHENAGSKALAGDDPNAHILQKGRKQQARRHHFEETEQEACADYTHIHAHDNQYESKYPARQRDGNLHLTENDPSGAKIETCWDHKEARRNSAFEPCMDGERLPGDHGHTRQKHRRLARKHKSDHANSTVKVLDGDVEPKQERIAEEAVNGQTHWLGYTNGPFIPEDDSNYYVGQRERAHFPQWHHQFDPKPEGCEGSITVAARSLAQVHNGHGMQKEQNHPESLDEHENLSSCERVKGNSSPSRFSKPPQRPPPPVPPYRLSSLPNKQPLNSPPVLPQRCATLETGHARANQEPHVHPKLPEYEDLVASFAALRNKPARPPTY